jgi:hypothetical protein
MIVFYLNRREKRRRSSNTFEGYEDDISRNTTELDIGLNRRPMPNHFISC